MGKMKLCAAVVIAAGSLFGSAQAAMLTDWSAGDVLTVTDPLGDANHLSRDITAMYFRQVGGTVYFRLDIGGAPIQQSGAYAPEYGIHINFPNGQGGGANPAIGGSNYIAEDIGVGIDTIVLSHYTLATGWTASHRHTYQGPASALPRVDTTMLGVLGGAFDSSEGGGTILQWSLPASALVYNDYNGSQNDVTWMGGEFTIWGATQSIDVPSTFDTTVGLAVPEPSAVLLVLAGAMFLRRR